MAVYQVVAAKLFCTPAGTAGLAQGPIGRVWGDQDPIRSENPGPDTAGIKGSHTLASRASLPRPGANSLFPNCLEKCQN